MQRRLDGAVDFFRGWSDYKTGFGNPTGEYWLGKKIRHYVSLIIIYIMLSLHKIHTNFEIFEFLEFVNIP